jgi:hypothetical protein
MLNVDARAAIKWQLSQLNGIIVVCIAWSTAKDPMIDLEAMKQTSMEIRYHFNKNDG